VPAAGSHLWKPQPPLWSWGPSFHSRLFQGGPAGREGGGSQGSHIKGAKKGGKNLEEKLPSLALGFILFHPVQANNIFTSVGERTSQQLGMSPLKQ